MPSTELSWTPKGRRRSRPRLFRCSRRASWRTRGWRRTSHTHSRVTAVTAVTASVISRETRRRIRRTLRRPRLALFNCRVHEANVPSRSAGQLSAEQMVLSKTLKERINCTSVHWTTLQLARHNLTFWQLDSEHCAAINCQRGRLNKCPMVLLSSSNIGSFRNFMNTVPESAEPSPAAVSIAIGRRSCQWRRFHHLYRRQFLGLRSDEAGI